MENHMEAGVKWGRSEHVLLIFLGTLLYDEFPFMHTLNAQFIPFWFRRNPTALPGAMKLQKLRIMDTKSSKSLTLYN